MRYRKLGRTGIEVSVICQGCWSLVEDDLTWGRQDLRDSVAAVGRLYRRPGPRYSSAFPCG